jgi:hypothetical protein
MHRRETIDYNFVPSFTRGETIGYSLHDSISMPGPMVIALWALLVIALFCIAKKALHWPCRRSVMQRGVPGVFAKFRHAEGAILVNAKFLRELCNRICICMKIHRTFMY